MDYLNFTENILNGNLPGIQQQDKYADSPIRQQAINNNSPLDNKTNVVKPNYNRYDPNYVKDRLGDLDFSGVAEYMRHFKKKSMAAQMDWDDAADELEREGAKMNAILNSQDTPEKKNMVKFLYQRDSGQYGHNPYAQTYLDLIQNDGTSDDSPTAYYEYTFDDDNAYDSFVRNSGFRPQFRNENNENYAYLYNKDGDKVLRVYKSAYQDSNFFEQIQRGMIEDSWYNKYLSGKSYGFGKPNGWLYGKSTIRAYDNEGNLKDDKPFSKLGFSHKQAYDMIKSAKNYMNETLSEGDNLEFADTLITSQFIDPYHQRLHNMMQSGQISTDEYKKKVEILKKGVNTELIQQNIASHKIYGFEAGSKSRNLVEVTDSKLKGNIEDFIKTAADKDKLKITAAQAGDKFGYLITVTSNDLNPNNEKNPEKYMQYDKVDAKTTQFFIPNLFEDMSQKLMNKDVHARISMEKVNRIKYHYDYSLFKGGKLKNFTNENAIYENENGEQCIIGAETINELMLENELIRGGIKQVRNASYQGDDDAVQLKAADCAKKIHMYLNNISNPDEVNSVENQVLIQNITKFLLSSVR